MSSAKKKKGLSLNQGLAITIVLLLVVIAGMLAYLIVGMQGRGDGEVNHTEGLREPTAKPTVGISDPSNPFADGVLETPYGTLYFPRELSANLFVKEVSGDMYALEFYARLPGIEDVALFDLIIADTLDDAWGDFVAADGNTKEWSAVIHEIRAGAGWNSAEEDMIFGMQDAVNELMGQIVDLSYEVVPTTEAEETLPAETVSEESSVLMIQTPTGEIVYTGAYSKNMVVHYPEGDVYRIVVGAKLEGREEILMFTFTYGGSEDTAVGYAKDAEGNTVPLNLMVYEFSLDESWTAEDQDLIYAIQEELNYFIDILQNA